MFADAILLQAANIGSLQITPGVMAKSVHICNTDTTGKVAIRHKCAKFGSKVGTRCHLFICRFRLAGCIIYNTVYNWHRQLEMRTKGLKHEFRRVPIRRILFGGPCAFVFNSCGRLTADVRLRLCTASLR